MKYYLSIYRGRGDLCGLKFFTLGAIKSPSKALPWLKTKRPVVNSSTAVRLALTSLISVKFIKSYICLISKQYV